MTERGYSVEHARAYGWGPEAPPDPQKVAVLRQFVIGRAVLDVGCATGTYVDLLSRAGFAVTGVDAFPGFLREAAARRRAGQFVEGHVEALPFPDKSFDTTILFDVLEHVNDRAALREAIRVTRQRILALVPLADPPELVRSGFVFVHHQDRTHLREYSKEELQRLFAEEGGHIVRWQPAYPANVRRLFADSLRLPSPFRFLLRAVLRLLRPFFRPFFSEVFIAADVRTSTSSGE